MTPHQALALGVRLFVVWCALITARELVMFLTSLRPGSDTPVMIVIAFVGTTLVLLLLWFFPKSIAQGLLPRSSDTPTQTASYEMWLTAGVALIGLWFAASAVAPIFRNISEMYFFKSELINLEDLRGLRLGLLYYLVELVVGLSLLFGAPGIRKLVLKVRHAGPD